MATYIQFLSYKRKLPWYKRILFPLFLNKKECDDFVKRFCVEQTTMEKYQDLLYFAYKKYEEDPCYENQQTIKFYEDLIKFERQYQRREAERQYHKIAGKQLNDNYHKNSIYPSIQ